MAEEKVHIIIGVLSVMSFAYTKCNEINLYYDELNHLYTTSLHFSISYSSGVSIDSLGNVFVASVSANITVSRAVPASDYATYTPILYRGI